MDQKIESRHLVNDFKTICHDYRNDYHLIPNKYDKLAAVLITQADILIKKYTDTDLIHTITCCFIIAVTDILIQEGSTRFQDMFNTLSKNWQINATLIKTHYHQEIATFTNFLKKNKSNSFFSTPSVFNCDVLANKYNSLHSIRDFIEVDEEQKSKFRRITAEEEDFLQKLCSSTTQSPRG